MEPPMEPPDRLFVQLVGTMTDRPQWKAFVNGLSVLESEQGS